MHSLHSWRLIFDDTLGSVWQTAARVRANITGRKKNEQWARRLSCATTCSLKEERVTLGWPLIAWPACEMIKHWDTCRWTPPHTRSGEHKSPQQTYMIVSQFLFSLSNLTRPPTAVTFLKNYYYFQGLFWRYTLTLLSMKLITDTGQTEPINTSHYSSCRNQKFHLFIENHKLVTSQ